jgi:hypothetical protein
MAFPDFHSTYKILFVVSLKHSRFLSSANVKPMPNDQLHAGPWQTMFVLPGMLQPIGERQYKQL